MQEHNRPTAERFDLVLEAISNHGVTVAQAAYYSGLRPEVLLEHLRGNPDCRVDVELARRAFHDSNKVA